MSDRPSDLMIEVHDGGKYRVRKHEGTPEFEITGVGDTDDPVPWGVKGHNFFNILLSFGKFEAQKVHREE